MYDYSLRLYEEQNNVVLNYIVKTLVNRCRSCSSKYLKVTII